MHVCVSLSLLWEGVTITPIRAMWLEDVGWSRWVRRRRENKVQIYRTLKAPLGLRQYICVRCPFTSGKLAFTSLTHDHQGNHWHGNTILMKSCCWVYIWEIMLAYPWEWQREKPVEGEAGQASTKTSVCWRDTIHQYVDRHKLQYIIINLIMFCMTSQGRS